MENSNNGMTFCQTILQLSTTVTNAVKQL